MIIEAIVNVTTQYPVIINSLVSIFSIYISNALGRNATLKTHQLTNAEKIYLNYHIPLMEWLYRHNQEFVNYYWSIAVHRLHINQPDFLRKHILKNIESVPAKAIIYFNAYYVNSTSAAFFYEDQVKNKQYEKNAAEASENFDKIIEMSLKEAIELANKLGYPNLAQPLLETFYSGISAQCKTDRYLPAQYRIKN